MWWLFTVSYTNIFFSSYKGWWCRDLSINIGLEEIFILKSHKDCLDMFDDAQKTLKKPRWLGDDMWNRLLAHWNTYAFHIKSTRVSINQVSGKGRILHTSGSISMHDHAMWTVCTLNLFDIFLKLNNFKIKCLFIYH